MSTKRLFWDVTEAFRIVSPEVYAKVSNFQDDGRSSTVISWDFGWVNQDIVLHVSTNFQLATSFCLIALDYS